MWLGFFFKWKIWKNQLMWAYKLFFVCLKFTYFLHLFFTLGYPVYVIPLALCMLISLQTKHRLSKNHSERIRDRKVGTEIRKKKERREQRRVFDISFTSWTLSDTEERTTPQWRRSTPVVPSPRTVGSWDSEEPGGWRKEKERSVGRQDLNSQNNSPHNSIEGHQLFVFHFKIPFKDERWLYILSYSFMKLNFATINEDINESWQRAFCSFDIIKNQHSVRDSLVFRSMAQAICWHWRICPSMLTVGSLPKHTQRQGC